MPTERFSAVIHSLVAPLSPSSPRVIFPGVPDGTAFPAELTARLKAERIVAVITIDRVADAVPPARALADGGVRTMELAWRTPATVAALAAIVSKVPEMLVGVGTLLSPAQVKEAFQAGAAFGVSPGLSLTVIAEAQRLGLPFAPGVQTPGDAGEGRRHVCGCGS